jgi:phosphoribosylamine---glycine ligase
MTGKKFLFISIKAYSSDVAWQLTRQGHSVKYFVKNQVDEDIGDGFVTKVKDWQPWVKWADVIVFDDIKSGRLADQLRQEGKLRACGFCPNGNLPATGRPLPL